MIRLITFDALHTLFLPRQPIHVQYATVFAPYVGNLDPDAIRKSFKVALKALQTERPAYEKGGQSWWADVIRRTALGAGADSTRLDESLSEIVPMLLKRFSSKEGYRVFDDAIPTLRQLHAQNVHTAVISNTDERTRAVLDDLALSAFLDTIVLSETEGVEKPSSKIFKLTLDRINAVHQSSITAKECIHIGDELECDYRGAQEAGWNALLLRRPTEDGKQAHIEEGENLSGVDRIEGLEECLRLVEPLATR